MPIQIMLVVPGKVCWQLRPLLIDVLFQEVSAVPRLGGPVLPYRLDLNGSKESISALRREDLLKFYEEMYPAQRLVVTIVGDIDRGTVFRVGAEQSRLFSLHRVARNYDVTVSGEQGGLTGSAGAWSALTPWPIGKPSPAVPSGPSSGSARHRSHGFGCGRRRCGYG
jgi:hypothetical protein